MEHKSVGMEKETPRALRILIYALIPEDRENLPINRSHFRRVINRARRVLDLARWRVGKKWRAHYSTFEDFRNTNRGDIAIRLSVKQHLTQWAFKGQAVTFFDVCWGDLAQGLKRLAPLDLVVIAGGGYLYADENGCLPQRFKDDVEVLARTTVPVVAISIGLNQLIKSSEANPFRFAKDQHPLLQQFLSRAASASVRDRATQEAVAAATSVKLPVIIDPAFLLSPEPHPPRPHGDLFSIGLNVAFHGTDLTEKNAHSLPILVDALRELARERPCRFFYFVHSNSERGIAAALRLSGISCEIVDGDPATLLSAYRGLDMHICQMLHSAIFAMSVGIPTLTLAYDVKSHAFFNMFGLDHLCLDMMRVDKAELLEAAHNLMRDRAQVAAEIGRRRAAFAIEAAAYYAQIYAEIKQPAPYFSCQSQAGPKPVDGNTFYITPHIHVSTVIPAYNARQFIGRALESVFIQLLPNSEIIVVDDGSTDGTREFVATYRDRGVKLICCDRRGGAAAARNIGIAAARGEYVAFLDADDEWLPGKIARQLAIISANPTMTFISCRANLIDENGDDSGDIYRGALPAEGPEAWRTLLAYPCVATPTVVARRQSLVAAGAFNKWLPVGEDQDMWIRLSLRGDVGHIPETLVRVYSTPNSLSKAAIRDQAGYVLPMVSAYIARTRASLSAQEVRRILGERHFKVGQWAYANRDWWFGLMTLWKAILYGQGPLKIVSYIVRASSVVQWIKRGFKRETPAFGR